MSWGDAQLRGQASFRAYRQFLCLPPRYPSTHEHEREAMFDRLRACISSGARAVLLVPTSNRPSAEFDNDWSRAGLLVRGVTGVEMTRTDPHGATASVATVSCSPGMRDHLTRHPGDMILATTRETPARVVSADECLVLAETTGIAHEPSAAAGFPGAGAWAILPWAGKSPSVAELQKLLRLLEELESLGRTRRSSRAVEVADLRASVVIANRYSTVCTSSRQPG